MLATSPDVFEKAAGKAAHGMKLSSGGFFDFKKTHGGEPGFADVAHHLALITRFAGATHTPYSVAQHSVIVSDHLLTQFASAEFALAGLLRDAGEAVTGHIPHPIKIALGETARMRIDVIERAVIAHLYQTLSLPTPGAATWQAVKVADMRAFATEWRDLTAEGAADAYAPVNIKPLPRPIRPVPWDKAEEMFWDRLRRLTAALGVAVPL